MSQDIPNPLTTSTLNSYQLKSLLLEIIGNYEVSHIRLPGDPISSELQRSRQLLLRIRWIYEILHSARSGPTLFSPSPLMDGPMILRILLLQLEICSSEGLATVNQVDYRIWRHVALDSIINNTRLLLLSRYELGMEEDDLAQERLQNMCASWESREPLSTTEHYLLRQVVPSSLDPGFGYMQFLRDNPWEVQVTDIVRTLAEGAEASRDVFWNLHDIITEASMCPDIVLESESEHHAGQGSETASRVIRMAVETVQSGTVRESSVATVFYQMRRLACSFGIGDDEGLYETPMAKRISRLLKAEIQGFRPFLTREGPVATTQWERGSASQSPLSVWSDERKPRSISSNHFPMDSRISTASARESMHGDNATGSDYIGTQFPDEHRNSGTDVRQTDSEEPNIQSQWSSAEINTTDSAHTPLRVNTVVRRPLDSPIQLNPSQSTAGQDAIGRAIPSAEHSMQQAGQGLPVSTFVPGPQPGTSLRMTPGEDESIDPTSLSRHPYPSSVRSAYPSSGLEAVQNTGISALGLTQTHENHGTHSHNDSTGSSHSDQQSRLRTSPVGHGGQSNRSSASELDVRPTRPPSVASSTASRSRHRFVGLFSRQNKAPLDPLPSSLQFCFSACGSYIALWCVREPRSIVRITQPFRSGRCLPLLPLPNGNSTDNRLVPKSIRHVACSDKTIVAIVHFEHSRWIYSNAEDDTLRPLVRLTEDNLRVDALTISPDNTKIALGCRTVALVCRLREQGQCEIERAHTNQHRGVPGNKQIRAHRLSFTADSQRLLSAVQVADQPQEHGVYTAIWNCQGTMRLDAKLNTVTLAVGLTDSNGIASVHSIGVSDSPNAQKMFMAAAAMRPYPSIISTEHEGRNRSLAVPDTARDILNCAQSWVLGTSHYFAIRTGPHKILRIDARTGREELVGNIAADSRGLDIRHECFALGMPGPDTVYALWKSGNDGLTLRTFKLRGTNWTADILELGGIYRQLASGE